MHETIQALPHVAFRVNDLAMAVKDEKLILAPYEPIPGFQVAFILDAGMPVELVQTELSDSELWNRKESKENLLYTANH